MSRTRSTAIVIAVAVLLAGGLLIAIDRAAVHFYYPVMDTDANLAAPPVTARDWTEGYT